MTREQLERKAALWDAIRRLWETGGVRLNPGSAVQAAYQTGKGDMR